jgi:hypothetical protein
VLIPLQALEFLLVRGSSTAVQIGSSRELQVLLQQLVNFEAIGHGGVDYGSNVRIRWVKLCYFTVLSHPVQV